MTVNKVPYKETKKYIYSWIFQVSVNCGVADKDEIILLNVTNIINLLLFSLYHQF